MPNTNPPPIISSLPSTSKTKPRQKKWSNPSKRSQILGQSKGKEPIADLDQQEQHVEVARDTIESMPETEVEPPLSSPTPQQSPIHINLEPDSPQRSSASTHSHSSGVPRSSTNPSSEISQDSSWIENQLGRKRRQPSYKLDFSYFDHVYQDTPAKKIKKQVHVERNTDKEIIIETTTPPKDKNLDEVEFDDFTLIKVNLGRSTRQADVHFLKVATQSIKERVIRDGEDKAALKAENQQLCHYMSNLMYSTENVTSLLLQMLELPVEKNQLNQLVVYRTHLKDQEEEFITRGCFILSKLYQLRYNAHKLRTHIQDSKQYIEVDKPLNEIMISHLRTAYDLVTTEEDKEVIFSWREQLTFKVKIDETISAKLVKSREKVTNAIKLVRTFMSQVPSQYQHEGGEFIDVTDVQLELQMLIHGIFSGDSIGWKLDQLTVMSALLDEVAKSGGELQIHITYGEQMQRRH